MQWEITAFRYRERFGMSAAELRMEPNEELERALLIWSMDASRANIEAERRKQQQ